MHSASDRHALQQQFNGQAPREGVLSGLGILCSGDRRNWVQTYQPRLTVMGLISWTLSCCTHQHYANQNRMPRFRRDADTVAEIAIASHNDTCDSMPDLGLLWR